MEIDKLVQRQRDFYRTDGRRIRRFESHPCRSWRIL